MKKNVLALFDFIGATFVTQAVSHFILFKDQYAAVSWIKKEPVFAFGILSMVI